MANVLGPQLSVTDLHVGGDVSRVVFDGVGAIPGASLAEQAQYLAERADGLRRMLLSEPHGNPSMSVDLIVAPKDPAAEAGFIVMEAMGYPAFSGTNAICTATALLEGGRLPMSDGLRQIVLEAPAGPFRMTAECRGGRVVRVTYRSDPVDVEARGMTLDVPGYGQVNFDLVWSGVLYPVVDAAALGFALECDDVPRLAAFGRSFVSAARAAGLRGRAPCGAASAPSFVLFAGPPQALGAERYRAGTAVYVHPGVICRSPTGTGTSARMALLAAEGRLAPGAELQTISCLGSVMSGTLLDSAGGELHRGYATAVTARAHTLGHGRIVVDPDDPLVGPLVSDTPFSG